MKRIVYGPYNPTGLMGRSLPTYVLRMKHFTKVPTGQMAVALRKVEPEDIHPFDSVASLFEFLSPEPVEVPVVHRVFPSFIIREASMIAARTRRGAGNVFLHAPDTIVLETELDRLRSMMECVPCDYLRPDQGFVMYRNRPGVSISDQTAIVRSGDMMDSAYEAVVAKDGSLDAVVFSENDNEMGSSSDYCKSFRFIP